MDKWDSRKFSIAASIVIVSLIVDTLLSTISDIIHEQLFLSNLQIVIFIFIIITIFGTGQILLGYVKQLSRDLRARKTSLNILHNTVMIFQYLLMGILAFIIIQIILTAQYYITSIIALLAITVIPASIVMLFLSFNLFKWYSISNKKDLVILLYGIAASLTASGILLGNLSTIGLLLEKRLDVVRLQSDIEFPRINLDFGGIIIAASFIQLNLAFILSWSGAALLLRHYSNRLGRLKYWVIIFIPLLSLLVSILPTVLSLYNGSFSYYEKNFISYRILSVSTGITGGVLFGVVYWTIQRAMRHVTTTIVLDYLNVAAYGIVMITTAIAAIIIQTTYPPFGIAASSFIALASYLYNLGIYSSAISVAEDSNLRQAIRNFAIKESSKLLDSIGTAQMEQQIQQRVIAMTRKHEDTIAEETGVHSFLKEEDIKKYLEEVLEEIRNTKTKE